MFRGRIAAPGPPPALSTAHKAFRRLTGRSMAWEGVLFYSNRCRIRGDLPLDAKRLYC